MDLKSTRIHVIDVVRGLVMIVMALDHVRDLLHTTSISQSPTDLNTTTTALFFTRWITHLCAPTFVFLSGTSVWLSLKKSTSIFDSRRFLLKRGLLLILIEFTVVNFGLWFDLHFQVFLFDVIAAIGFGFIVLSGLMRFSTRTIGIIGLLIILFHSALAFIPFPDGSVLRQVFSFFLIPGAFPLGDGRTFVMGYPPVPWLGIMLAGYAAGRIFENSSTVRRITFLKAGGAGLMMFLFLRFLNIYGDSFPWSAQTSSWYSFLSFINVTKYPPSLDFTLLFLGFMFLLLFALDGVENVWTDRIRVFGNVPLFYFVIHWYLIHPLVFVMVFLQGFSGSDLVFGFNFGRPREGSGVELGAIYLIWIGIVLVLYPLCKWYGGYKSANRSKSWLRYF